MPRGVTKPHRGMPLEFFKMAAIPHNHKNGADCYAKEQSHLVGTKGGPSFAVRRHSTGHPDPGNQMNDSFNPTASDRSRLLPNGGCHEVAYGREWGGRRGRTSISRLFHEFLSSFRAHFISKFCLVPFPLRSSTVTSLNAWPVPLPIVNERVNGQNTERAGGGFSRAWNLNFAFFKIGNSSLTRNYR